jgi:stage II sporulation protein AA (anti-sigma F factor antagonist)
VISRGSAGDAGALTMKSKPSTFQTERRGDAVIVTFVQHVLDPVVIEDLQRDLPKLLDDPGVKKLVLDFSRVTYFPSRLLGVLLDTKREVERRQGGMRLCGIQPMVMDVFRFMRLDTVLKIDKDVAEALAGS